MKDAGETAVGKTARKKPRDGKEVVVLKNEVA
jgi:hypothetical protein